MAKFDVQAQVTNSIIKAIEAGTAPWRKPWTGGESGGAFPLRSTGERYRGINILLLWCAAEENGFSSAHWFTYKQAADIGGQVRKGQKSSTVVKYGTFEKEGDNGEAKSIPYTSHTPRKLTLTAMLHYLWHDGDLVKWVPAMEGKRWWGVVRGALLRAASNKQAKGGAITDKLYIPEPFNKDRNAAAVARRRAFFANLAQSGTSSTPLGILIAEYKSHEPTRMGAKFVFKHLPGCTFFASADFLKQFDKVFEDPLVMADMMEGGHAMVIATFKVEKAGYPVLHELGMMVTDRNWLPVEHLREVDLVNQAVVQNRRFTKSLRFNLSRKVPIASLVLTDTARPTALFVANTAKDADAIDAFADDADDTPYDSWIWAGDAEMPELPKGRG